MSTRVMHSVIIITPWLGLVDPTQPSLGNPHAYDVGSRIAPKLAAPQGSGSPSLADRDREKGYRI